MALNYTVTYNGKTVYTSTSSVSSLTITCSGSKTVTTATTTTLSCSGKIAVANIVVGAFTMSCKGLMMVSDVVVTTTSAGYTYNCWTYTQAGPYTTGKERITIYQDFTISSTGFANSGTGTTTYPTTVGMYGLNCTSSTYKYSYYCPSVNTWQYSYQKLGSKTTITYTSTKTLPYYDSTNMVICYSLA